MAECGSRTTHVCNNTKLFSLAQPHYIGGCAQYTNKERIMKTISIFTIGAFVSKMASAHPDLFYLAVSILAGFLLALLASLVFVGPTPKPPTVTTPTKRQANVTQTARKTTKRQVKKTNFQNQHGIDIYNYPQGAYA